MKKFDVIVTRHSGLVDYLKKEKMIDDKTQVLTHAMPDDVVERNVCGVLPHALSCLTKTFTELPLVLPAELRGQELNESQVRKYCGELITYTINKE